MKENEVAAVVAHEMTHIMNGDMVTMTLLSGILNTFVIFFARVIAGAISTALRDE
jgi:heat shock protein HtpX